METKEAKKHPLIGEMFDVGPHGYVLLKDFMGSDADICEAARVSYRFSGANQKNDLGLINYLMEHKHTTPFEMAELKFEIALPIFVERQWIRHRTASTNEASGRYTELPDLFYTVSDDEWRTQSTTNKQGSSEYALLGEYGKALTFEQEFLHRKAYEAYKYRLDKGVAKEIARIDLPLSTYTVKVWKIDLHNLLHFLKLRTDPHAQQEIRDFADVMYEKIVKPLFPVTCEAWENFVRDAVTFSAKEVAFLKRLIGGLAYTPIDHTVPNTEYHINETLKTSALLDEKGEISARKLKALTSKLALIGIK